MGRQGLNRRGFMAAIGGLCLLPAGVLSETATAVPDADAAWKDLELSFGPESAKTKLVLWMNLADPECAWRFDQLASMLFDTQLPAGDFRLSIRDVCDGRQALWAALAARSGGEVLYRPMASSLYMGTTDLSMIEDPNDLAAAIIMAIEHHGVPKADIMKAMSDRDLAMRLTAAAKTAPAGAMPRAFLNGKDIGLADPAALGEALDAVEQG